MIDLAFLSESGRVAWIGERRRSDQARSKFAYDKCEGGALRPVVIVMACTRIANIGPIDRSLRVVLGWVLRIAAYDVLTGVGGWFAAASRAVLVVTALIGICPAYSLPGVSTGPDRLREHHPDADPHPQR